MSIKLEKNTLLPECVSETISGVNALSRAFREACEGLEGGVKRTRKVSGKFADLTEQRLLMSIDSLTESKSE